MATKLVSVIADYGDLHDLAFGEVTQRLYAELLPMDVVIKSYAVPAFDTMATGFALAQMAANSRLGDSHKFFVNTAPRKDDLKPRVKSAGEGLSYFKLPNGVEGCVVNSGYSLSFLRDIADEIRSVDCSAEGSQFRSRDVFPQAFAQIVKGDLSILGDDIRAQVPDIPDSQVCYTDGYGNLKLSLSAKELDEYKGRELLITINDCQYAAKVTDGIFGVADGDLCLAPGSSGWPRAKNSDDETFRFAEIVVRGGSAAELFNRPPGGAQVSWQLLAQS